MSGEFQNAVDKKMGMNRETAFKFHRLNMVKQRVLVKSLVKWLQPNATTRIWLWAVSLNKTLKRWSTNNSFVSSPTPRDESFKPKTRWIYDKIFSQIIKTNVFETPYPKAYVDYNQLSKSMLNSPRRKKNQDYDAKDSSISTKDWSMAYNLHNSQSDYLTRVSLPTGRKE